MDDLLSLDLIEAFVAVATQGSVTQAARSLHRSQPAISQRLNQLESQLGVEIFVRQGRALVLTDDGKRLLSYVAPLMVQWRTIPERLKESQTISGSVKIGAFSTTVRHLLADSLIEMMQTHPQVKCVVQTGLAGSLFQQLRAGVLDVMYIIGDMDIAGLDALHLRDIAFCVVMSPLMWPHDTPPTAEFLAQQKLVLWRGATDSSFDLVERHAKTKGWVNAQTYEVPHIETLKVMAQSGACFALLPDYVINPQRDGLRMWPLEGFHKTFALKRYLVQNRYQSEAVRTLMTMIDGMILEQGS